MAVRRTAPAICLGFTVLFSSPGTPVVDNSTLNLTNSTLEGNIAQAGQAGAGAVGGNALGGGLAINVGSTATVTSSTFNNNIANGSQITR